MNNIINYDSHVQGVLGSTWMLFENISNMFYLNIIKSATYRGQSDSMAQIV